MPTTNELLQEILVELTKIGCCDILHENVLVVTENGNDDTGERNNLRKTFRTVEGALVHAQAGDMIWGRPGDHIPTGRWDIVEGVSFFFEPGFNVIGNYPAHLFNGTLAGTVVRGSAKFRPTNTNFRYVVMIAGNTPNNFVDIECDEIYSEYGAVELNGNVASTIRTKKGIGARRGYTVTIQGGSAHHHITCQEPVTGDSSVSSNSGAAGFIVYSHYNSANLTLKAPSIINVSSSGRCRGLVGTQGCTTSAGWDISAKILDARNVYSAGFNAGIHFQQGAGTFINRGDILTIGTAGVKRIASGEQDLTIYGNVKSLNNFAVISYNGFAHTRIVGGKISRDTGSEATIQATGGTVSLWNCQIYNNSDTPTSHGIFVEGIATRVNCKDIDIYLQNHLAHSFYAPTHGPVVKQGDIRSHFAPSPNVSFTIVPDIPYASISTGTESGLIYGGQRIYTGGLSYELQAPTEYKIAGTLYQILAPQTVTHSAAHATLDRIDLHVVDNTGTFIIIEGTPEAIPSEPEYDPATQLRLGIATIEAGATVPTNAALSWINREGADWTGTSSATFNLTSTTNPFQGANSVEGTNLLDNDHFTFDNGVDFDTNNVSRYSFEIEPKAIWEDEESITIEFLNSADVVLGSVVLTDGLYGFDSFSLAYQTIIIPIATFNLSNPLVRKIRTRVSDAGTTGTFGFYVDNQQLQSAATNNSTVVSSSSGYIVKTSTEWTTENPTLAYGTLGIEITDTGIVYQKLGDGITDWNTLPYNIEVSPRIKDATDITLADNVLVSGGAVTWSGSNLDFDVSRAVYYIQGNRYDTLTPTTVTLANGDPTNDRIDIIALDTNNAVIVIQGTPAAVPVAPFVDPELYYELTSINVIANATTPAVTQDYIYRENTEWNISAVSPTINPDSLVNPLNGTKAIEGTNVAGGEFIEFTPAVMPDLSLYSVLRMPVWSKANWNTRTLRLQFYNGTNPTGAVVTIGTGYYGFDSNFTGGYQTVAIPLADFALAGTVTGFRITRSTGGGTIGFFIDDIELQEGVTQADLSNYYTISETNNLLSGKADAVHDHDDRYYTETEVNDFLAVKLAVSALDQPRSWSTPQRQTPQQLTDGATITWNLAAIQNAYVTLGGNRTLAFSNLAMCAGQTGTFEVIQDGTGTKTLTMPASVRTREGTPIELTATANAVDVISYSVNYNGTKITFSIENDVK